MTDMTISAKYRGVLAAFFDLDHAWHDHRPEAEVILRTCRERFGTKKIRLLDLCCATGNHALLLGRKGIRVCGVDGSPDMIRLARGKLNGASRSVEFKVDDVTSLERVRGPFNGAYLMGLSLMLDGVYRGFPRLLRRLEALIEPGGFFMFDAVVGTRRPKCVPRHPLHYRLGGLEADLRIREGLGRSGSVRGYRYEWRIRGGGQGERSYVARERLRIIRPEDLDARVASAESGSKWRAAAVAPSSPSRPGYRLRCLTRTEAEYHV